MGAERVVGELMKAKSKLKYLKEAMVVAVVPQLESLLQNMARLIL